MAETSGPFDPVDPANPVAPGEVLAENNWEWMLQHVVDGIPGDLPTSTQLKPTLSASTARGIDLAPGRMLVRGHWYNNSATKTITSNPNSSGSPRIDRAVARLNRSTNQVTAELLEGSPGGVIPVLTDNATITERPICRWTIQPGGTVATELLDERLFPVGPVLVCTSGTRPGGLIAKTGQILYETDTGRWRGWTGSSWALIYDDTGWVSLTPNGVDGHVWTPNVVNRVRRINGNVQLRIALQRQSGLSLPTTDDGSAVMVLDAQFWPTQTVWLSGLCARSPVIAQVNTAGEVRIIAITADIAGGRTVFVTGSWFTG